MWEVALLYQLAREPDLDESRPGAPDAFWSAEEPAQDRSTNTAGRKKRSTPYHHVVLGRMTLGAGKVRNSEHAELLRKDGYELGARTYAELAVAGVIAGRVALGPYAGLGWRSDTPSSDAPLLRERVWRYGAEVSLLIAPASSVLVTLGPQLGALQGALDVHGDGETQTVLEFGGIAAMLFRLTSRAPVWYFGATIGYTIAPAAPPSGIGRDYDYGALYLGLTGVIGG